ncbi:MAG: UbiA family prenyltransferase, partial [Flavobacteriia bacterium]
ILVGAGSCSSSIVLAFFLFTSIQVMIGSSIRDIADIQKDQNSGMNTLPVRFGIKNTVRILNALNLCSLGALFFALETNYWIVMALVFLWRAIVLAKVKIPKESILWTQTMNILTCTLLLLTMLVIKISPWIFS